MKITLLFNSFGNYHRQNVAVDSFRHLRQLYPDTIQLKNLQFVDEKDTFQNPYPDIDVDFCLRDSKSLNKNFTKKLPVFADVFAHSVDTDSDYFIIVNSDCMVMPIAIQYILDHKPKAWACSRMDINPIPSFQNILNQQVTPVYYEVGGFDMFVFEQKFAKDNTNFDLFYQNYLMGQPVFDVVMAGYMKVFGDNTPLGNGFPPVLFHIKHDSQWRVENSPEKDWNLQITKENHLNNIMYNIMVFNLTQNLLRRTAPYFNQKPEERTIEKIFFDTLNIKNNLL